MDSSVIVGASAGLVGVIIGALLGPWASGRVEKQRQETQLRIDAKRKQLEIYRQLYQDLVIMPDQDPEHYFSEWDDREFNEWLSKAVDKLMPNLQWVPDEVLEKLHGYRELSATDQYDCEHEVRWLYGRIHDKFNSLRQELKIE